MHVMVPSFLHAAPVVGTPLGQWQTLVAQVLGELGLAELMRKPCWHVWHIAAPFLVQPGPVLGVPCAHLHLFTKQAVFAGLMLKPGEQLWHFADPFRAQDSPDVGVPCLHVHTVVTQGVAGSESMSWVPGGHSVQSTWCGAENVPLPHLWHGVAGFESKSAVPRAHGLQEVAPAFEKVPAGHLSHTMDEPCRRTL